MLSSILKSDRAIQVNIQIIRTFTKLRQLLLDQSNIKNKIAELESKYDKHDQEITIVFDVIDELSQDLKEMKELPEKQTKKIGFK